ALLVHSSIAVAAATLIRQLRPDMRQLLADPLRWSALASSGVAVPVLMFAAPTEATLSLSAHASRLAALWVAIAVVQRVAGLFTAFQAALTVSLMIAVKAVLERQAWYAASSYPLLDPWSIEAQGIALSLLSLVWVAVRIGFDRFAGILQGGAGGVIEE